MITVCPSCTTKFRIPENSISNGDMVQCSVCQYDWVITTDEVAQKKSLEYMYELNRKLNGSHLQEHEPPVVHKIIVVSGLLLLLVVSMILLKNPIMERFPLSVKLYDAVGLSITSPVKKTLFVLVSKAVLSYEGNETVLVVRGSVRNTLTKSFKNVSMEIQLHRADGSVIKSVPYEINKILKPSQVDFFKIKIANPSTDIVDVTGRVVNLTVY